MKKSCFLILFNFFMLSFFANSQNISVIHIQGDVKIMGFNEPPQKAKNLIYGPIVNGQKVIVSNNSRVRFLRTKNEICDITKAGIYDIKNLSFINLETNSIFSKFCDYFHSFFINHSSSESKESYKNNIYAISRGGVSPPSLDFPLPGILPIDAGTITFTWTNPCDTCHYIFSIYDFENKKEVVKIETNEKQFELKDPQKFLYFGKKYYWNVKIKNQILEYNSNSFTIAKTGDYEQKIQAIKTGLENDDAIWMDEIPKTIYIMGNLQEQKLNNYALIYAMKQAENSIQIKDISDRFLYDQLLKK